MRASEWQFLCAVHEQPKSCCAIDYCCHTLDWAANVVSDQNIFPSRFVILNDTQSKNVGLKNLVNVFRRLHRIFAHAWFQHRSVFWAVEGQSGLYVFFKTVCDLYDLLPAENYKLPPEAEGLEAPEPEPETATKSVTTVPTILKPSSPPQQAPGGTQNTEESSPHGRTTTRRHIRSSPSTGSAVTTVMETDEEETDAVTRGMSSMHLAAPPPNLSQFADEPEMGDSSIIVNDSRDEKSIGRSADANKAGGEPEVEAKETTGVEAENATAVSAIVENGAKSAEQPTEDASTSSPLAAGDHAPLTEQSRDTSEVASATISTAPIGVAPIDTSDTAESTGQDTKPKADSAASKTTSVAHGADQTTLSTDSASTTAKVPSSTEEPTEEAVFDQ